MLFFMVFQEKEITIKQFIFKKMEKDGFEFFFFQKLSFCLLYCFEGVPDTNCTLRSEDPHAVVRVADTSY